MYIKYKYSSSLPGSAISQQENSVITSLFTPNPEEASFIQRLSSVYPNLLGSRIVEGGQVQVTLDSSDASSLSVSERDRLRVALSNSQLVQHGRRSHQDSGRVRMTDSDEYDVGDVRHERDAERYDPSFHQGRPKRIYKKSRKRDLSQLDPRTLFNDNSIVKWNKQNKK